MPILFKSPRQNHNSRPLAPALLDCPLPGDGELIIIEPTKKSGEGILRTAEALANDPYWDAIMEQIQRSRRVELRPQGSLE